MTRLLMAVAGLLLVGVGFVGHLVMTLPDDPYAGRPDPFETKTLQMATGEERTYLIRLPKGYRPGAPVDVVFNFHGSTSNARAQWAYGNFDNLADRDQVILVAPDGNKVFPDRDHIHASYWDSAWEANQRVRDHDIDFVLAIIDLLKADHNIRDLYAAGMSAGGDMVSALQYLPDSLFKAFSTVTYRYVNEAEMVDSPARPTISFHGDQDSVVPIDGSGPSWNDPPVMTIMQRIATHNGCDPAPTGTAIGEDVIRFDWQNCAAPVVYYLVKDGGHTWPGGQLAGPMALLLGRTTQTISATDLSWQFFFGSL